MAKDVKQNDELIDFDELDELPDVVLGEKTRAMRIVREENKKENPRRKQSSASNKKLDKVDVYAQTTGIPSVDELLNENITVDTTKENEDSITPLTRKRTNKSEETQMIDRLDDLDNYDSNKNDQDPFEKTKLINVSSDSFHENTSELDNKNESSEATNDLDLESIKHQQKFKTGTRIDYLGNIVEIEDYNVRTQRYKIFDGGRTKWVTEKNLKLVDPEIPESLQDEDPGVKDELSEVLDHQDEENLSNQDSSQKQSNQKEITSELNDIYEDASNQNVVDEKNKNVDSFATAKHLKKSTTLNEEIVEKKQSAVSHDAIPFSEVYKDTYDSIYHTETMKEKAIHEKRRNQTPMKQKIITGIIIVLLILLGVGVFNLYSGLQPVSSTSEEVAFEIEEGSTARSVAESLEQQGIIKNADVAYTYARIFNLTDVKQGLFTLDKSWDIKQMWTYLNDQNAAKKDEALVTIIEGDWAKDAASKFAEVTNVSSDDLLALWNNREWIESQKEKYPFITDDMFKDGVRIYLEGYLAPNTYYIPKETTAEEITTTLLDQTLSVYNKYADDIANSGHSIADIYTMASIIQYEAGTNPDDLAKVASVFYNRLNQGMALQSSVTVCYAIDFDKLEDNWQSCEINSEFESPYNTYKYTGLTPGPIENAGEAALEAAIHPAETNYLYFMAEVCDGQDGTVHYAETLDEHNANVSKYLTCY